jgi:hypothetical protein
VQTLDCLVALNGDRDFTIQKTGITVAEAKVLQHLHGDDAVFEILPGGKVRMSRKEAREMLMEAYPAKKFGEAPIALKLYPSPSDVPLTFDDLDANPALFRVLERAKPPVDETPFDDAEDVME